MRSIILILAFAAISVGLFAQTDSIRKRVRHNDENRYDDKQDNSKIDRAYQQAENDSSNCAVTMVNGKVMMIKDGQPVAMERDMVMRNGTMVMTDGTVRTKEGETIIIKEGDCLDRSGRIALKNIQIKENPKGSPKY